jgi:hypothetical protein
MSLYEKLHQKLQPHVDRVEAGNPNDYDYLPAVLFACLQGNKQLASSSLHLLNENQIKTKEVLEKINIFSEKIISLDKTNDFQFLKKNQLLTQEKTIELIKKIDSANAIQEDANKNIILHFKITQFLVFILIVTTIYLAIKK